MNQLQLIGLLCMLMIISVTYFYSFGVENIPKEIKYNKQNKIKNRK